MLETRSTERGGQKLRKNNNKFYSKIKNYETK
jgi:hypothetical protein